MKSVLDVPVTLCRSNGASLRKVNLLSRLQTATEQGSPVNPNARKRRHRRSAGTRPILPSGVVRKIPGTTKGEITPTGFIYLEVVPKNGTPIEGLRRLLYVAWLADKGGGVSSLIVRVNPVNVLSDYGSLLLDLDRLGFTDVLDSLITTRRFVPCRDPQPYFNHRAIAYVPPSDQISLAVSQFVHLANGKGKG